MSVDTVNVALSRIRRSTLDHRDMWLDNADCRLSQLECMRGYLMKEDIKGFIDYVQRRLATTESMQGILEDLFADLCGDERAVWEQFEAILRAE